jgi:hypothetical protein
MSTPTTRQQQSRTVIRYQRPVVNTYKVGSYLVGVAGFKPATPSSRTTWSVQCGSMHYRNLQRDLNDISVRSFVLTGAPVIPKA